MFRCRAVLLYECVHHNLFVYMQVFSAQNSVFCVIWYLFLYSCYIISILYLHVFVILNLQCRLGVTMVVRRGGLVLTNVPL